MMNLIATMRALAWKLADLTVVAADWDGFRAEAVPGDAPAGLIRWAARLLTSVGYSDTWWWLPYAIVGAATGGALGLLVHRRRRCLFVPLWTTAGLFVAFRPLFSIGDMVWSIPDSSVAFWPLLMVLAACGLFAAFRPLVRRYAWGLPVSAVVLAFLFAPFGVAVWMAGIALVASVRPFRPAASASVLVLLAFALPFHARFTYGGLAHKYAFNTAWMFCPLWKCGTDVRPQLEMEKYARAEDWEGVMSVADAERAAGHEFPLRMEIAWRIFAQYRLGRLPDDLFKYPIRTDAALTDADQRVMGGHEWLYRYGLALIARRDIHENVSGFGWLAGYLRVLGDIAYMRGEVPLAWRYYRELERRPFHGAFARARLAALANGPFPAELEAPAAAMRVWTKHFEGTAPRYMELDVQSEETAYSFFRELELCPSDMARMSVTAVLLAGGTDRLAHSPALADALVGGKGFWPVPVQEAVVAYEATLDPAAVDGFRASYRSEAVDPAVRMRFESWLRRAVDLPAHEFLDRRTQDALIRDFGGTYWFYLYWVKGAGVKR